MPRYLYGTNIVVRCLHNFLLYFLIYLPQSLSLIIIITWAFSNTLLHLKTKPDSSCRSFLYCLQSSGSFNSLQLPCVEKAMLLALIPSITSSSIHTSPISGMHWHKFSLNGAASTSFRFLVFFSPWGCVRIALPHSFISAVFQPPYIFSFCPWSNHCYLDIYCQAGISNSKSWHLFPCTNQHLQILTCVARHKPTAPISCSY